MVRLLLSCDDSIVKYRGQYYAANQDRFTFYQRYLRVFDKLKLVARCEEEPILKSERILLLDDPRIEYVEIPAFHGPRQYAKVYFQIGRILNGITDDCDAAILRIPSTIAMRVGKKVLKSGIPYATEVVFDAEDAWRRSKGMNRLLWKKIDTDMRVMCAKADGVSCVTDHYLQQHYFSCKPQSFFSSYSSLALDASFYSHAKLYPHHKPLTVVHVSNQVAYNGRKGHIQLLEAIRLLKDRGIVLKVKFAGADYRNGIAQLLSYAEQLGVREMTDFVGYLSRPELDSFLSDADIFVMPTIAEGLPRVIIEAMAKGLPCITTPVSGNPELVSPHFLVDYYDTKVLSERIEELTTNPQLYEQISRENYERSWKYEASVLEQRRDIFYAQLCARVIS